MNAPALPAAWQAFASTVRPIFPQASEEEVELRSRILLIRDLAIQAMSYATEEAYSLLGAIQDMAGRYALAAMTVPQLKEMRRILVMASAAANSMQVLVNDIHHSWAERATEAEGADGRG